MSTRHGANPKHDWMPSEAGDGYHRRVETFWYLHLWSMHWNDLVLITSEERLSAAGRRHSTTVRRLTQQESLLTLFNEQVTIINQNVADKTCSTASNKTIIIIIIIASNHFRATGRASCTYHNFRMIWSTFDINIWLVVRHDDPVYVTFEGQNKSKFKVTWEKCLS